MAISIWPPFTFNNTNCSQVTAEYIFSTLKNNDFYVKKRKNTQIALEYLKHYPGQKIFFEGYFFRRILKHVKK